jgi:hypothetical protein
MNYVWRLRYRLVNFPDINVLGFGEYDRALAHYVYYRDSDIVEWLTLEGYSDESGWQLDERTVQKVHAERIN